MNCGELVSKWGHIVGPVKKLIPTWTEDYNLAMICEKVQGAKHAVELGTYMGASARCILMANPSVHLWCVDTFAVFGTQEITALFLESYIKEGRCELIKGDSVRAAEMLVHMRDKIDFVFVDDGHATEDVKRDIAAMKPLLAPGAVMLGHDFEVPHNDVAQGVIQSGIKYSVPVPRLWMYEHKQSKKCCGQ